MSFPGLPLRFAGLAFACCALALSPALAGSNTSVQTLANFPVLQKLSRDGVALRKFLDTASDAYRAAGYGNFARELRRSVPLVSLFGQPEDAEDSPAMKKARATLLRLKLALKSNSFVKLPEDAGESAPDYYRIASVFIENAGTALKNLARDKNVATSLRNKRATFWLTKTGSNSFSLSSSGRVLGTITLNSTSTYTGAANLAGATLSLGYSSATGSITNTGVLTLTPKFNGGTAMLISPFSAYWIAFLPDEEIPADLAGRTTYEVEATTTVNGIELPAGTKIIVVPNDYEAPVSAIVLTEPAASVKLVGGTSPFTGTAEVVVTGPTPTPSPTPAE